MLYFHYLGSSSYRPGYASSQDNKVIICIIIRCSKISITLHTDMIYRREPSIRDLVKESLIHTLVMHAPM